MAYDDETIQAAREELGRRKAAREELARRRSSRQNEEQQPFNREQISQQMLGNQRTTLDTIRDALAGGVRGLGKGGEAIASLATGGRAPTGNVEWLAQQIESPKKSFGGELTKGIASYAPYGAAGGAGFLGQLGAGAAHGGAMADEGNRLKESLLGALLGGGINALTHGAFKGLESLRPSKLFRGKLSPEELTQNLQAAQGTETGLGDVVGSPFLKRQYENVLSKMPLSGATEKMQNTAQQVVNKGENVLGSFLPKDAQGLPIHPENANQEINDALMRSFEKQTKEKNNLYKEFNEEADKQLLDMRLPKFSSKVKEHIDTIEDTNVLKNLPGLKKVLSKLNILKEPVIKTEGAKGLVGARGEPLVGESLTTYKLPTGKEANLLKAELNKYANQYKYSSVGSERHASGIFQDLSRALKTDIKDSLQKSGNKNLIESYDKAEKNYQQNFSPYLDKLIHKYASGQGDSDLLAQSFIKNSVASDRSKVLSKLTNKLSDREQKLLAYSYFSRALDSEGNLQAGKLSTLIKKLRPNQFKALVPDKAMRDELKNYHKLYGMNTKAVNLMYNPATGQQNLDILPAMMGHAGSSALGGKIGGLPGAIAGMLMPGVAARPLIGKLTNPNTRENLVNAMIKNRPWDKKLLMGAQSGLQGLNTK